MIKTKSIIRFDFIFSYWIFIWFLLYFIKLIPFNPKVAISCAIIVNIYMIIYLIYKNSKIYNIIKFILINVFIKLIPLIIIINTKTNIVDIYFFIFLINIYILWMYLNNKNNKVSLNNFIDAYYKLFYSYMTNKNNNTFFGYYYDWLYEILVKKIII
jgi:hypothetical protein